MAKYAKSVSSASVGAITALAVARSRSPLADFADSKELVPAERNAELMSPIEPERTLNDWGRSERVEGFMDETLFEFFYRYWFRV